MQAKTALLAAAAILATLTIASAQQAPRNARRQPYLQQPFPAQPYGRYYYDDAAPYRRSPQGGVLPAPITRHSINPGGVGTDSALQR
jgi:hypothetical protein